MAEVELWLVLALMAVFIAIGLAFRGKCPKCKRFRTFKKTGVKRKEGSLISRKIFDEYRCKQCGHTESIERSSFEGGDGGE